MNQLLDFEQKLKRSLASSAVVAVWVGGAVVWGACGWLALVGTGDKAVQTSITSLQKRTENIKNTIGKGGQALTPAVNDGEMRELVANADTTSKDVKIEAQGNKLAVSAARVDQYQLWMNALLRQFVALPGASWKVERLCAGSRCGGGLRIEMVPVRTQ